MTRWKDFDVNSRYTSFQLTFSVFCKVFLDLSEDFPKQSSFNVYSILLYVTFSRFSIIFLCLYMNLFPFFPKWTLEIGSFLLQTALVKIYKIQQLKNSWLQAAECLTEILYLPYTWNYMKASGFNHIMFMSLWGVWHWWHRTGSYMPA